MSPEMLSPLGHRQSERRRFLFATHSMTTDVIIEYTKVAKLTRLESELK